MKFLLILISLFGISFNTNAQEKSSEDIMYWIHPIKSNETIHSISSKYGVKTEDIKTHNNLKGSDIKKNVFLKIPIRVKSKSKDKYIFKEIGIDESLHGLAKKAGINPSHLIKLNGNSLDFFKSGKLALVPNPSYGNRWIKRSSIQSDISLGYFASNSLDGEDEFYYSVQNRTSYRQRTRNRKVSNSFRVNSQIGFRQVLGQPFHKYLDKLEIRNQLEYKLSDLISPFIFGRIKSQYSDTYIHYEDDYKKIISSPFAPAYINNSVGLSLQHEYFNLDFAIYESKTTLVLSDKVYNTRTRVFGVEKGEKVNIQHGISLKGNIDFMDSDIVNIDAYFYSFIGPSTIDFEFNLNMTIEIGKRISISTILELYYDRLYLDQVEYRNELVLGYRLFK